MGDVNPQVMRDRFRGVLLGVACGDALGGPVEFLSRDEISSRFPHGVTEFVGGGWLDLAPGEVTDDTQQTLILARSLTRQGLDLAMLAEGLLTWYRSEPKDIGNTTRVALQALAEGASPHESGLVAVRQRGEDAAAANGGVMRCAPVALRFLHDPEGLVAASLASARITHAEERAAWATVAVNQAIAHLALGGALADAPTAAVAGIDQEELRNVILGASSTPREAVAAGGFVLETVGAAFWALGNFPEARSMIEQGVALGEDADSTGAVIGAMAGAHFGAAALPARWRDNVQFRDELLLEADRLLALAGG